MEKKEMIENFMNDLETEAYENVIERYYTNDAYIQKNQNEPIFDKVNLI